MSRFLLVSYKPNSDDYCRGCHMASYSSDLVLKEIDDIDELIDEIAILDSTQLDTGEEGYDHDVYTVGQDGITQVEFTQEMIDKLQHEKEQRIALIMQQERAAEQARQELIEQQTADREKSQLLKLIEKYGVPNEATN